MLRKSCIATALAVMSHSEAERMTIWAAYTNIPASRSQARSEKEEGGLVLPWLSSDNRLAVRHGHVQMVLADWMASRMLFLAT